MKTPNISDILWSWSVLDGFDFLGVNMNPIFIDYEP